MSKRKIFCKVDLRAPSIAAPAQDGQPRFPPKITRVFFPDPVPNHRTYYDFAEWYGIGIDEITYACQEQITRLLEKQDADVRQLTVITYCGGLNYFLEYAAFCTHVYDRDLKLPDIDRSLIDGYLQFLAARHDSTVTQKGYYYASKAVIDAMGRRGILHIEHTGDDATFPRNPFPNNERAVVGAPPYSLRERNSVAMALRKSVQPIFTSDVAPNSKLLTAAVLLTALYTGRNTAALLEMTPEALVDHPKGDRVFLLLHKRRGRRVYKAALNKDLPSYTKPDTAATASSGIERLLRRVIALTEPLRQEAPVGLSDRVWICRTPRTTRNGKAMGTVIAVSANTLVRCASEIADEYDLRDDSGNALRINISRLRKTFINRVFELLGGDLALTAIAAGNTPRVTGISYLRPGKDTEKNWRFMGEVMSHELMTSTIGATEKTPSGGCTDPRTGQYAASTKDELCTSFLNCIRCRNYVVTGDDLYRVFSLYWRVLAERERMTPRQWKQQFSHIVRLIDRDVMQAGVEGGMLKQKDVDTARLRARVQPHPFWNADVPLNHFKAPT